MRRTGIAAATAFVASIALIGVGAPNAAGAHQGAVGATAVASARG